MTDPDSTDPDRPIWGARAIGEEINRDESQAFYLLENKRVDADKVGKHWVSTRRRLRHSFQGDHSE
jgi:hypothetical protein